MWTLEGLDTFSDEMYPLPGSYPSQEAAEAAAREHLAQLEREQPTRDNGGQAPCGIQDRVFVVSPTGQRMRVFP